MGNEDHIEVDVLFCLTFIIIVLGQADNLRVVFVLEICVRHTTKAHSDKNN